MVEWTEVDVMKVFLVFIVTVSSMMPSRSSESTCNTMVSRDRYVVACNHHHQQGLLNVLLMYKENNDGERDAVYTCLWDTNRWMCSGNIDFHLHSENSDSKSVAFVVPKTHIKGYFSCATRNDSPDNYCRFTLDQPLVMSLQIELHNGAKIHSNERLQPHTKLTIKCSWKPGDPPMDVILAKDDFTLQVQTCSEDNNALSYLVYTINDLQCWHSGTISCKAHNAKKNQSLLLNVNCDQSAYLSTNQNRLQHNLGYTSTLKFVNSSHFVHVAFASTSQATFNEEKSTLDHFLHLYIIIGCILFSVVFLTLLFGLTVYRRGLAATPKRRQGSSSRSATKVVHRREASCSPPSKSSSKDLSSSSVSNAYEDIHDNECSQASDQWAGTSLSSESLSESPVGSLNTKPLNAKKVYENETGFGELTDPIYKQPKNSVAVVASFNSVYLSPIASNKRDTCVELSDNDSYIAGALLSLHAKTYSVPPVDFQLNNVGTVSAPDRSESEHHTN